MPHRHFENKKYWQQMKLWDEPISDLTLTLTIRMSGDTDLTSLSFVMTKESQEEWLEAEVPYMVCNRADLPALLVAFEDILIEADTYLLPF